jgi:hypothetical protein
MSKSGRRHPLLVYRRLFGAWRLPALIIAVGSGALWWIAPAPLTTTAVRLALLATCGTALVLFVYTLVGPRLSYVQCRPNHLLVSTPLYRLAVSYRRIHTTRPVPFKPEGVPAGRQWLAAPYRGLTALAVDLNGLPVERRFLRLWFNEFVLPKEFVGLLLVVPEWMTLSREIESYRGEWKTHRKDAGKDKNPLTSLSSRRY